jgi:hypothetical protein
MGELRERWVRANAAWYKATAAGVHPCGEHCNHPRPTGRTFTAVARAREDAAAAYAAELGITATELIRRTQETRDG